jgi:hypothetical protein
MYEVSSVMLFVTRSSPMATRMTPLVIFMALKCFLNLSKEERNALMAMAERMKGTPRPSE